MMPGTVTPAASRLVLSLFPGAGLLDRGFEQAGFCVVRGPDTLLGQRVEDFSAPAGHFCGVIGGPPCQDFSRARRRPPTGHGARMLAEFGRLVTEAKPDWWLIENVPGVPDVHISNWVTQRFNLFAWEFGCRQSRNRSFQFGSLEGLPITVLRGTESHLKNGLARAVLARDHRICICGCGRLLTGKPHQKAATAACRKRMERERRAASPGVSPGLAHSPGVLPTPAQSTKSDNNQGNQVQIVSGV